MKKKIVFIGIVIIAVSVFAFIKTRPKISQAQAEEIALPIITMCWDNEDSRFHTVSMSSKLIHGDFDSETKLYWRVGGNYYQDGFPVTINDTVGSLPEVLINAMTGKVVDIHFVDIDEPNNPDCRQK